MSYIRISREIIVFIAILLGLGLTIFGLLQEQWPDILPTRNINAIINYVAFVLSFTVVVAVMSFLTRRRFLVITIVLGFCIAIFAWQFFGLLAIILYAVASLSVGHIIFNFLKLKEESIDDIYRVLAGTGFYASLVSISAHFPINYTYFYFTGLLLPIVYKFDWLKKRAKNIITILIKKNISTTLKDWPKVLLSVLSLFYLSFAFLPELGFDALAMHLLVPAHISINHEWGFDPTLYVWSFMLMLGDWNYTIGYLIADEVGARLINIGFVYILMYLIRELVLWSGGDEAGAIWAMLLFLSTPITFTEGSSLFVESIWASYFIASVIWVLKISFDHKHDEVSIVLLGCMLGFAIAAKAATFIYLPILLLLCLYCARTFLSTRLWMKSIILCLIIGVVPYGVAYWMVGNPVFPLYNAYFNSPFYPTVNFDNALFRSAANWDLPYQLVFASEKYIEGTLGAAGFQWTILFLPVLALILISKNKRAIALFSIGGVSIWLLFLFQSYLRYAFPILLILSVLIGLSITLSRHIVNKFLQIIFIMAASVTVVLNLIFLGSGNWPYRDIPVMEAFNQSGRDQLLLTRAPIRKAVELINSLNQDKLPVVFLSSPLATGLAADALYDAWYNYEFSRAISGVEGAEAFAKLLNKYNAKYVVLDSNWSTEKKRDVVMHSTLHVKSFGTISVRMLNDNLYAIE